MNADGGAQSFLPATEENAALDFAGTVKRGIFIVQQPRPQHEAVGGKLRPADGAGIGDGLQHGKSLSPTTQASNKSFSFALVDHQPRDVGLKSFRFFIFSSNEKRIAFVC
jgi:hypothetical protein